MSVSADFGDFDPDDAVDTEPPAPEQVAYRLHALRAELDALAGAAEVPTWAELTVAEQALALDIGAAVVNALMINPDPAAVAEALHNVRRYLPTSRLPAWADLDADDRGIGVDLMSIIVAWLRRQGAIT